MDYLVNQAYSKDGLAAAANNDPETQAKLDVSFLGLVRMPIRSDASR
jgi:hypothetical protein